MNLDRTDPGVQQIRALTRLIKAGVPPRVALSLVKMWRALEIERRLNGKEKP